MAGSFPHPDYARYVLEPGFRHSQELLWDHMVAANEAHVLMLHSTGIISDDHAAALLAALLKVSGSGSQSFVYAPEIEDLFFQVEARLIEYAGAEAGGNLQIARSRNDLAATLCRLMVRDRLSEVMRLSLELRRTLIDLIDRHRATLMPGITHTQPAQPTTLGHYLLGVLGPLERDFSRLALALSHTNRSPLGAAAFTTTSFPIDRDLTARLLGFDGFVVNGYDAVGAADHLLEATQAPVTMVASLSRFVGDLLIWARAEVGLLHVADEFIQISSIMPQKRNPVILEHIRTRIGYVYGEAATVAVMVHGAAFGDTNDVEDPIYPPIARLFAATSAVLTLLNAVLASARFDVQVMLDRAHGSFMTTTALADGLVRDFGLPFRTAHHITALAVKAASRNGGTAGSITAAVVNDIARREHGDHIDVGQSWLDRQLDPAQFVAHRRIPGGPAEEAVRAEVESATRRVESDEQFLSDFRQRLAHSIAERQRMIADVMSHAARSGGRSDSFSSDS